MPTAAPTPSPATPAPTRTPAPGETPAPTPLDLLPFLEAQVDVLNLGDAVLSVRVVILDPESTDEYDVGTLEVAPQQQTSQAVLAARYRLEFDYPGGRAAGAGTCVFDVEQGDLLEFALVEGGGVVSAGEAPDRGDAVTIEDSPLCRAGAGG